MSTTIWSGGAAAGLYLGTGLILALLVHTYYPGALGMREWIRVVLSWPLIFFLGSKEDLPGALKKLVATIALLCVSNTVLAHDIYSNLRDRDGHLCCGGQDCKPVVAIALVITIYQRLVKLFPPTWQHHRLIIASIIVPIIQCFQCSLTGLDQYLKAHPKLDASLLQ